MQTTPLRKIRLEKQLTIAEKLAKFYDKKSLKCKFFIR